MRKGTRTTRAIAPSRGRGAGKTASEFVPDEPILEAILRAEDGRFSGKIGTALVRQVLAWHRRTCNDQGMDPALWDDSANSARENLIRLVGIEFARAILSGDHEVFRETSDYIKTSVTRDGRIEARDPVRLLIAKYTGFSANSDREPIFTLRELVAVCKKAGFEPSERTIRAIAGELGVRVDRTRGAPVKESKKMTACMLDQRTRRRMRLIAFFEQNITS